jgi:hypothetical protein
VIELIIEKWSNLDGTAHHLWSLWREGKRVEMSGRLATAESAESQGRAWCETNLGRPPDRVTRL